MLYHTEGKCRISLSIFTGREKNNIFLPIVTLHCKDELMITRKHFYPLECEYRTSGQRGGVAEPVITVRGFYAGTRGVFTCYRARAFISS